MGATTSILVHEIRRQGIPLTPLEASVMLLGIHEDTGSLTYPGSTAFDAEAAAFLMGAGAELEVVNEFLARTLDPRQQNLLEQLTASLTVWDVNGQDIAVGVARTDDYVDSAGVLTHYVVEDMGFRAAIAVISMPERVQIVGRSRLPEIDIGAVLTRLGGGGHAQAASAGFREISEAEALHKVREALEAEVSRRCAPATSHRARCAPSRPRPPCARPASSCGSGATAGCRWSRTASSWAS